MESVVVSSRRPSVLVVDADPDFRRSLTHTLEEHGCAGAHASTFEDATGRLDAFPYDGLITDVRLPDGDGLDVLEAALERYPRMRCVVVTAHPSIHHAVRALKRGAIDYLVKPLTPATLVEGLKASFTSVQRDRQQPAAVAAAPASLSFAGLLGRSQPMQKMLDLLSLVSPTQSTVLIEGETGTGKELVARTIHANSPRRDHPFVAFNAAAIPDGLAEAELFGHVKGAFTGAVFSRVGRFEAADRGTLFIDEISSISMALQAKLLRVLQEREIERVGTSRPMKIDTRVIAASNVDVAALVREGRFREDLYYRLNVVRVQLPPLRARTPDIPLLARHFIEEACRANAVEPKELSQAALQTLMEYSWPGNVRQLQNAIERAVVMSGSRPELLPDVLPSEVVEAEASPAERRLSSLATPETPVEGINFASTMSQVERDLILTYLKRAGGNKRQAARMLSLSRTTLIDKLHRLGVTESAERTETAAVA
jgi:DNA-binding NtrC family response regulator